MLHRKVGDRVQKGEPLLTVHHNDLGRAQAAGARALSAYTIGQRRPRVRSKVLEVVR